MVGSDRRLLIAVTTTIAVNMLVLPQLAALRRHGWQIHLVCSPGRLEQEAIDLAESVTIVPMARAISPVHDLGSIRAMRGVIRRVRPSIVVGSTPKAAMISMVAARMSRVPVRVFQVRGARWEGETGARAALMKFGDRVAVVAATDVLAVSRSLADLLEAEGVTRRPATVLGAGGSKGVDTSVFFPGAGRAYDPAAPVLGFAGRLSVDKGLDVIVRVVDELSSRIPGLRMEIVGDLDDAQSIPPELAVRIRASSTIDWMPSVTQPELAARMRGWDLLVFPSQREGLPNVVIEAAACGVPVVAWDVTGVRDAVDVPGGGRLVARGDVQAFVAAALECLAPDVHAAMVAHAADWTVANFDGARLQESFAQFLDEVGERQSPGGGQRTR